MNRDPRTEDYPQAAYEILAYLLEHPEAEDTLDGIVHWWLLEQKIRLWSAEAKSALGELVAQGFVLERRGGDGRIHYSVNPQKAREAEELLRRRAEDGRAGADP